jgi:Cu/Zn superoxide dismutase
LWADRGRPFSLSDDAGRGPCLLPRVSEAPHKSGLAGDPHLRCRGDAQHGLLNPEGPEEGDLPNIHAAADGSANAELSSESIMLMGPQGLKDSDGSALVIHASEDDHLSQPIGNAGARVACAVIK